MFLLTRDQARAYYGRDAPAGGGARPPRPLDPKQELYRLLGLIPERSDLRQQSLDNLITLILGFYSPELDALYLLEEITGGLDGVTAQTTIVHELVHALQDQYHDLPALQAARADDWDATIALLDVMEGDAIAAEIAYFGFSARASYRAPLCFGIPDPLQPGVPRIVERELDTLYEDGLCFVQVVAPRLPGWYRRHLERPAHDDRADPPPREIPRRRRCAARNAPSHWCRPRRRLDAARRPQLWRVHAPEPPPRRPRRRTTPRLTRRRRLGRRRLGPLHARRRSSPAEPDRLGRRQRGERVLVRLPGFPAQPRRDLHVERRRRFPRRARRPPLAGGARWRPRHPPRLNRPGCPGRRRRPPRPPLKRRPPA